MPVGWFLLILVIGISAFTALTWISVDPHYHFVQSGCPNLYGDS